MTDRIDNHPPPGLSDKELLSEVQYRACHFFWAKADPKTGLINDRAKNRGNDEYEVASIASTGYGMAALPIAVQNGWQTYELAYNRALLTLRFINSEMEHTKGWYFHFVHKNTGKRVWNCELSSIDTALLLAGALVCGQFFSNTEVHQLANELYERVDWQWMLTNGGERPDKFLISHGWKPETGFLPYDWGSYCELMLLYLLGMGAPNEPLLPACWSAWNRPVVEYKGHTTLFGGPIFVHQMTHGFYDFKNQCDREGWNYWVSSVEATYINQQFCIDNSDMRKTYSANVWGLNACDYPDGYRAFSAPGDEDGTVSPTGAIASIIFTPDLSQKAANALYAQYSTRIWGQFGFANAFNVDRCWYDTDVIGIDLGMALLNIENAHTGLIWELLASHPSTAKAWKSAGFRPTSGEDSLRCSAHQK